jgi:hypothetical protein
VGLVAQGYVVTELWLETLWTPRARPHVIAGGEDVKMCVYFFLPACGWVNPQRQDTQKFSHKKLRAKNIF